MMIPDSVQTSNDPEVTEGPCFYTLNLCNMVVYGLNLTLG